MRAIGDGRTDNPQGLFLEGGQQLSIFTRAAVSEGNKTDTEPPNKLLLGSAIQLDTQQPRVLIGQLTEQRFFQGIFVEQTEISIVCHNHQVTALLGGFFKSCHQRITFSNGRSITTGVIREVKHDNCLAFFRSSLLETRLESLNVTTTGFSKGSKLFDDRTTTGNKSQIVVAPHHIGHHHLTTGFYEQVSNYRQTMV